MKMHVSKKEMISNQIRLEIRKMTTNKNTGGTFNLVIKNDSQTPVKLDNRLLNITVLVSAQDHKGNVVSTLPPPVPRQIDSTIVSEIASGGEIMIPFSLISVFGEEQIIKIHKIQCVYDNQSIKYPDTLHIWQGLVVSNTLELVPN
jgi:hypothetical protein